MMEPAGVTDEDFKQLREVIRSAVGNENFVRLR